jgi:hypothetical protein
MSTRNGTQLPACPGEPWAADLPGRAGGEETLMIVSASYKTDIPAFYGEWFMGRLEAGHCRVANPYGGPPFTVPLRLDAVDGFVFWTRNLGPFADRLEAVAARGFPFVVQYTVTGYPRALDAATIAAAQAVGDLRTVAGRYGRRAAVWRYDPIVFSSATPPAWHRRTFAELAGQLAGAVDEVVVSVAQIYRKTTRNLTAAARLHGFTWDDPGIEEKRALVADLTGIAAAHGLKLAVCGQPELIVPGAAEARCIDVARLSDVAGRPLVAAHKAHRACDCDASRDIGDYDTCPHGCAYCYAVQSRPLAKRRFAAHDPAGEFLFPPTWSRRPGGDEQELLL